MGSPGSPRSVIVRTITSAVAGMVVYGGWAYVANAGHGTWVAVQVAGAQGVFSFGVTLGLSLVIEAFYRLCGARPGRVLLTIATTCALLHASVVALHVTIGTPALLLTVLPASPSARRT